MLLFSCMGSCYYVWSKLLCVVNGIMCGLCYYVWSMVLCVVNGIMCGQWYYVWSMLLCVDSVVVFSSGCGLILTL